MILACYKLNILAELYFWWRHHFFCDVIFPQGPNFSLKKIFFYYFLFFVQCSKKNYFFIFFYFLVHFWYWDLFRKGSMLQMWAQFWRKKNWNPIPYKISGKLPKFHANWIKSKKVIKRKPTGGHIVPPPPQSE